MTVATPAATSQSAPTRLHLVQEGGGSNTPAVELLSSRERQIALALVEALLPGGGRLPGGDAATVVRLERFLAAMGGGLCRGAKVGLWAAESSTLPRHGRLFSGLPKDVRASALEAWANSSSSAARLLLRAIVTPLKLAHFDHPSVYEHVGCSYGREAPKQMEPARWMEQVTVGREVHEDLELECEVVIVGTGAGGGAAAYELAKRGRAVLLLEAGEYHQRTSFNGGSLTSFQKMYLGRATTFAVGNAAAGVWAGRGVGGSTTINSGTCYRAPEWTLSRWGNRYGLTGLSADALSPYYDRVEDMLGVAEAPREHLGGVARVIARGASIMNLSHAPLRRNAPGCDGQGVCCFGCPTGAKRSTDVSYVPEALKRGAQLVTGATVMHVDRVEGRARGVTVRLASGKTLKVRADVVIAAGGALMTPLLLQRSGLCGSSGWLGKNLSIHPATKVMALFRETIDMSRGIPQSYSIDEYAREGIMFEGASLPIDITALGVPWVGRRFMDLMGQYANLATFGLMIQDRSRGEVRAGVGGLPFIRYNMNREDQARMRRGVEILSEIFLRAGAERVLPLLPGCDEIQGEADLDRLRKAKIAASDFEVTAYHPLGTCRMGTDRSRSCVGPDGEAHDTKGLFVADGSALPSSLGVNPQLTIMAVALRTAEAVDSRLDDLASATSGPRSSLRPKAREGVSSDDGASATGHTTGFVFAETMRGQCWLTRDPERARRMVFQVGARSAELRRFMGRREVVIEGTVDVEGFATGQPLTGTLGMDVLLTRKLPYDFRFTGDDGCAYRFVGEKNVRALSLLDTMSRLPGEIRDEAGGVVGRTMLFFDLRGDLVSFLRSFKLARV